jgi:hypothetical protein
MPILGIMASQMSGKLWQPDGAYDSLATVTVGSGGVASVTFAGIPNTYKHLQIRGFGKDNRASSNNNSPALLTVNNDTGANYSYHELTGNGTSAGAYGAASVSNISAYWNSNSTDIFGAFVVDILDYASINKFKTIRTLGGTDRNGSGQIAMTSGAWLNTAAITSVTFTPLASPIQQYSQVSLYGVR